MRRPIKFILGNKDEQEDWEWSFPLTVADLVEGSHIDTYDENTIVREWTGLHDKNGKEIYEGDIVTLGNEHYVVSWDAFFGLWQLGSSTEGVPYLKLGRANERLEIVGNIYENPDLLTI